jgi:formylglycine-generating enzyme required for sulfatase activity
MLKVKWIFLICIVMLLILTGCAKSAFKNAQEKGTIASYNEFIQKYGDSKYASQAKKLREELRFKKIKEDNTIPGYEQYLKEYPNGIFASEANKLREELRFKKIKEDNTIPGYEQYLKEYPNGIFASEANKLREELRFKNVKEENTISVYDQYLKEYPNGIFASEANKLREELRFKNVKEENTISVYDQYLKEYPNGIFAPEANKLRENCMFAAAKKLNTTESYYQYLIEYPNGAFVTEVNKLEKIALAAAGMVFVKGGCFQMGSDNGDSEEKPVHQVCVGDFYLGKYEVTRGQWAKFVAESGYSTEAERNIIEEGCYVDKGSGQYGFQAGTSWRNPNFSQGDKEPVVCVSWHDAAKFANWLSRKDGRAECYDEGNWQLRSGCMGYSLPSEAEWEYAARCGAKGYRYDWGDKNPSGRRGGNVGDESRKRKYAVVNDNQIFAGYDDGYVYTAPVGSFDPNCYGLYDMTGNVMELTNDWYGDSYYGSSPSSNPVGPSAGSGRVGRGGGWDSNPRGCRTSFRGRYNPANRSNDRGFRLRLSSR